MRLGWWLTASVLLAVSNAGCATIVKGGKTTLEVHSPTPNAEITIKSFSGPEVYSGPSPAKVVVAKDQQYTVEVKADGYKPRKQAVTKSVSGWMFGNVIWVIPILWGVGIAVDAMSGALWTLDPETQTLALAKAPPTPPPAPAPPVEPPPPTPEPDQTSGY